MSKFLNDQGPLNSSEIKSSKYRQGKKYLTGQVGLYFLDALFFKLFIMMLWQEKNIMKIFGKE